MANDELDHVFDAYFADPDLWVAILTGAGDKAFSAGNDLVYSASGKPMWVPKNGFAGLTSRASMPKPVIAAVNGFAMGGGCEIALACHLVVADATARFALSEVKVGLVAGAGGLIRLPRTVPPKVATEMILTGRRLGADEALAYGLVNRVVPAGTAVEGARALAAEILEGSPTSVRVSLRIMAETRGIADVVEAVNYPSAALDELMASEDAIEGMTAFAARRRPRWRNRYRAHGRFMIMASSAKHRKLATTTCSARCRRLDHRVRARVDEPGLAVVELDQIGRHSPGAVYLDDLADLVRMPDAVAVNADSVANGRLHVRTSSSRAVPTGWQLPA